MSNEVKSENAVEYLRDKTTHEDAIIAEALEILRKRFEREKCLTHPAQTMDYLRLKLGELEHEVFGIVMLDNRNFVIDCVELFRGTIDGASVYPREVVKEVMKHNAASVVFYHNHPSGHAEPSQADIRITERLVQALRTIDVRVLDHVLVGGLGAICFSERGLI